MAKLAKVYRPQKATPKTRKKYLPSLTRSRKDAVYEADPNGGRCLVTLERKPKRALKCCHLVPRTTSDKILTQLEWAYGVRYLSLHVDIHRNLCLLRSDFHLAFDDGEWLLLPDLDFIAACFKRIMILTENKAKEHLEDIVELYGSAKTFNYYMIPRQEMDELAILRRFLPVPSDEAGPSASHPSVGQSAYHVPDLPFKIHTYPYASLGSLQSHVQPHFVMYNAGMKLDGNINDFTINAAKVLGITAEVAAQTLINVSYIYRSWITQSLPESFFHDPGLSTRRPREPGEIFDRGSDPEFPKLKKRRRSDTADNDDEDEDDQPLQKKKKGTAAPKNPSKKDKTPRKGTAPKKATAKKKHRDYGVDSNSESTVTDETVYGEARKLAQGLTLKDRMLAHFYTAHTSDGSLDEEDCVSEQSVDLEGDGHDVRIMEWVAETRKAVRTEPQALGENCFQCQTNGLVCPGACAPASPGALGDLDSAAAMDPGEVISQILEIFQQ